MVQPALLAFLLAFSATVTAQQAPHLVTRFANPAYDRSDRTYSVDIQVTSLGEEEVFFGMNLRFFYDATMLEYKGIDQYAQGLGYIRETPRFSVGTDQSGVQLLGLDRAAGYVNGGVEAKDASYPVVIRPGAWAKLCRATFRVTAPFQDAVAFCPALVWDKKPYLDEGGLLGSDGVLVSVQEKRSHDPHGLEALHRRRGADELALQQIAGPALWHAGVDRLHRPRADDGYRRSGPNLGRRLRPVPESSKPV